MLLLDGVEECVCKHHQKAHVLPTAGGREQGSPMSTGVHFVANQKYGGHYPTFVGRVS